MGSDFRLGEKCIIKSSKRIFAREYVEKGIPFWRSKDVIDKALGVFNSYDLFISKERFEEIDSKFGSPKKDDLLISSVGNRSGQPYVVEEDEDFYFKDGNILWMSNFEGINPRFLAYWLKSELGQSKLASVMIGSAQKALTIDAIRNLDVHFPSEAYQNKVVDILLSLDKKITLNRQTNQTLEKMAQTLFKSWFVDFDPVFDNLLAKHDFKLDTLLRELPSDFPAELLAKAEKRLNARLAAAVQKEPKEQKLNDAIHPHFPSEFEHNEKLGWIPKGWSVAAVSKAIKVNPRVSLPKGTVAKFADMKAIPTVGYIVEEITEKAYSGGAKFQQNDVLLARITPCLQNGKTALVDFLSEGEVGFGSTEFIVLRANGNIPYSYVACLVREESFRLHCMQSMVGSSGRQRVQNACFDAYYLALPAAPEILISFSELTETSFEKMSLNSKESQYLSRLRDTLLPRLISGEVQL